MLDLSDNTFRKTFGFSEKKKKESISKDSREISSPRKVAQRFEQLKYKRLILDQYEV